MARAKADGSILAVELERTAKGRSRLRGILAAYVAARHIGHVRYYPTCRRVQELIRSEVARLSAERLVQIDDSFVSGTSRDARAA